MNTRQLSAEDRILPSASAKPRKDVLQTLVEDVAFDKAEDAASAEKIREALRETEQAIKDIKKQPDDDQERLIATLERKQARLESVLKHAQAQVKAEELSKKT